MISFLLCSYNFDSSTRFLSSFSLISSLNISDHFLISAGDELSKIELERSNEVLFLKILNLCVIIDVINFNNENLLHFEIIIDLDFHNEFRIQIICDNFSLSKSLLLFSI
jgi:hypothetical protein